MQKITDQQATKIANMLNSSDKEMQDLGLLTFQQLTDEYDDYFTVKTLLSGKVGNNIANRMFYKLNLNTIPYSLVDYKERAKYLSQLRTSLYEGNGTRGENDAIS